MSTRLPPENKLLPIPQMKPKPLVGNAWQLDANTPLQSIWEMGNKLGPIFKLAFPGQTVIALGSQELVNEICDEKRFDKRVHASLENIRDFAGDGLFTAYTEEPNWGLAHRILAPAFGPVSLRNMFPAMLDIAEQMLVKWERQGGKAEIDIVDNMTRLTLDTIALSAFDYRFNSFYQSGMHPFVDAMLRSLTEASNQTRRLPIQTKLMLTVQRQYAEDNRIMHQIADELISIRRRGAGVACNDLLNLMLTLKDPVTGEGLSDINIRYQIVTFLIAGHETTSGLLSFATYFLLKHPEALAKVRAEVDRVLGGGQPRFEHISQLTYIDQVLKESLRLWPTAPAFAVYPHEGSTILGGRYAIDKDAVIMAILPLLHRDKKVWGPDADEFNPDRMEREKFNNLPPNAWKPFGNGQRACIGRPFAMQEATLVLAMVIQRFDLTMVDPKYKLKVKEALTLKPDGLFVHVKRRDSMLVPVVQSIKNSSLGVTGIPSRRTGLHHEKSAAGSLHIYYGSATGSCESFAQRILADATALGYRASISVLNNAVGKVPPDGVVIIVTSSYEGKPTDNAAKFVSWLDGLAPDTLSGVKFGVFGCGHTDWARTYQAIPKFIDEKMQVSGAQRIIDRGEADARGDFFGDFDLWYAKFWPRIAQVFGVENHRNLPVQGFEVEFVAGVRETATRAHRLVTGVITENRELVDMSVSKARSKRHIEISLPANVEYRAGDYLSILPSNSSMTIDRVLKRFGLSYDSTVIIRSNAGAVSTFPLDRPISCGEIIASFVEVNQAATRRQIETLANLTPCPPEKAELVRYMDSPDAYQTEILVKQVSVIDLLERYNSCSLTFGSFIPLLPPLKPRQYSISSSPLWSPDHCSLTVAVVQSPAFSGAGMFNGVASTFLAAAVPGTGVAILPISSNQGFRPPADPKVPMIMACAGTGIAPFRGFLQERSILASSGVQVAESLLFFGCDHPDVDLLYKEELESWVAQGILRLRTAFSEMPDGEIKFVQHRIWQAREEVAEFYRNGAHGYVCGDGRTMAPAVRETFMKIYQEKTGCTALEVDAWMAQIERNSRYVADVFS